MRALVHVDARYPEGRLPYGHLGGTGRQTLAGERDEIPWSGHQLLRDVAVLGDDAFDRTAAVVDEDGMACRQLVWCPDTWLEEQAHRHDATENESRDGGDRQGPEE